MVSENAQIAPGFEVSCYCFTFAYVEAYDCPRSGFAVYKLVGFFFIFCVYVGAIAAIQKTFVVLMAGLEELKKKLTPLFDAEKGLSFGSTLDPCDSYMVITVLKNFRIIIVRFSLIYYWFIA